MSSNNELRKALLDYLGNSHTHAPLREAASDLPEEVMNRKPEGLPYTFWDMLEHIRISQWDMVDFIVNPNYKEMQWPKEYWPAEGDAGDQKKWDESIEAFEKDYVMLQKVVADESTDLFSPIPHGTGQTILKEVLQIIDHNGYHIGQLIAMRKMMGEWKK